MFHMLTCFNLKPGEVITDFGSAIEAFAEHMKNLDLVHSMSPIAQSMPGSPIRFSSAGKILRLKEEPRYAELENE